MALKIHEPEAAMDGKVIRISNIDRPSSWKALLPLQPPRRVGRPPGSNKRT